MINWENLANDLIDNLCDEIGVYKTIEALWDIGLNEKDLYEDLKFDSEDILHVLAKRGIREC